MHPYFFAFLAARFGTKRVEFSIVLHLADFVNRHFAQIF